MKQLLLCLFTTIVIAGCIDCGPQKELVADISIRSEDSLILKKVYAKNAVGEIETPKSGFVLGTSYQMYLPISMHEDQTTYIFEFENRTDSLTLFYKREFYYKTGCGFVIDIDQSKIANPYQSSFKYVELNSNPYVGPNSNSLSYNYYGGIRIYIDL